MKKVLILFCFTILGICVFCQEGLLIRNLKTGKAWMYEKNAKVTYILFNESEYTTARLTSLLDSSVVFGKDTVKLKDIAGIRKKSPSHTIFMIAGMPMMLIGSIFMGDGLAVIVSNPNSDGGKKLFLLGAGVFIVGYIPFIFHRTDLTVGFKGEWSLEICKGCALR